MKSASYLRTKKQITEDLVQKIQDAETLTLFSSLQSQESGEACEHGKYSGIIILLRDNPTDKGGVLWLWLESGPDARFLLGVWAVGEKKRLIPQERTVSLFYGTWKQLHHLDVVGLCESGLGALV